MSGRLNVDYFRTGALVACALLASAASAHQPDLEFAKSRELLVSQMESWNRGDLDGALRSYCPSEDITWVNRSGVSHGYASFAQGMRSQFGGTRSRMGTLKLDLVETRLFGDGSHLLVVRWSISQGTKRLMGGISSQLWADCDGKMRIIFEHSS